MRHLLFFLLLTISFITYGQEVKTEFDGHKWEAPYLLPTPKEWTVERFLIPISFAPQIAYTGIEDIRFTPGWSKTKSEEYWSYAFLWYLDGTVTTDTATIEKNLNAYYTGLVAVNGKNIPAEKVITVTTSFKTAANEPGSYTGTVTMTDYMQQTPITLNCKVHLRSCAGENKTFIFYELSPQPLSHKVWTSLDNLWFDFKCKR